MALVDYSSSGDDEHPEDGKESSTEDEGSSTPGTLKPPQYTLKRKHDTAPASLPPLPSR
ncbi:hypothetical protein V491_07876, partial [Pseudogymnoascus sp. VKM F-3775]